MCDTQIEPEIIRIIAAKRHGLAISLTEAEIIREKIIAGIGETLDRELMRLRDDRTKHESTPHAPEL